MEGIEGIECLERQGEGRKIGRRVKANAGEQREQGKCYRVFTLHKYNSIIQYSKKLVYQNMLPQLEVEVKRNKHVL